MFTLHLPCHGRLKPDLPTIWNGIATHDPLARSGPQANRRSFRRLTTRRTSYSRFARWSARFGYRLPSAGASSTSSVRLSGEKCSRCAAKAQGCARRGAAVRTRGRTRLRMSPACETSPTSARATTAERAATPPPLRTQRTSAHHLIASGTRDRRSRRTSSRLDDARLPARGAGCRSSTWARTSPSPDREAGS